MTYLKLAAVAAIVAGILWGAHWLFQRGVDSATLDINKANKASETVADKDGRYWYRAVRAEAYGVSNNCMHQPV